MSPTLTTFLFEAANFLVLAAVLGWLFFKPVRRALNERRAQLAAEAQQAAEKLAEAEHAQQEVEAARGNLQQELDALRARELETARRQADRILADARQAAQRELALARSQAARMSETQRDALAQVAANAAAQTVGQLLEQISGPELHAALVDAACRQLRALPLEELAPVKVESTQPLAAAQRAAVDEALGPAAEDADYRTVEGLGAGVKISTARGLIDATTGGLEGYAQQSLVRELNHRANHQQPLPTNDDA